LWKRAADTSVSADLATCSILNTARLCYLMKMVKFLLAVQLTRSGS
jgi:positive regulator of sigma E activity